MNAQVDTTDAYQDGYQNGDRKNVDFVTPFGDEARDEGAKRQVNNSGQQGMTAGKAIGIDVMQLGDVFGARARKVIFQGPVQEHATSQRQKHEEQRIVAAGEEQESGDHNGDQTQHREAPKRGDVPDAFFDPARSDGIGKIGGISENTKHRLVEGFGFSFVHFVGNFEKDPNAGDAGETEQQDDEIFVACPVPRSAKERLNFPGHLCRVA